ncbi:MAG: hypothetical protein HUN04_16790 [Desulfobacter sp.]|nr:MAG: hypothetical protein HUN04_16790 [Desulfobacter sp.]
MEKNKERREREERRSGVDRRRLNTSNYTGVEKRSNPECRNGVDRRDDGETWIEYLAPVRKK